MSTWSDISKRVGFGTRAKLPIPTLAEVEKCENIELLLMWQRFCEPVDTMGEMKAIDLIMSKLAAMRNLLETEDASGD